MKISSPGYGSEFYEFATLLLTFAVQFEDMFGSVHTCSLFKILPKIIISDYSFLMVRIMCVGNKDIRMTLISSICKMTYLCTCSSDRCNMFKAQLVFPTILNMKNITSSNILYICMCLLIFKSKI